MSEATTTAKKPKAKPAQKKLIADIKEQKPKAAKPAKDKAAKVDKTAKLAKGDKKPSMAESVKAAKEQEKADKLKAKADAKAAQLKAKADAKAEKEAAKSQALVTVSPEELALAVAEADQIADEIKLKLKRTAEDLMAIGEGLNKIKALLPHGQFMPYVEQHLGLSQQSASNFMNVASRFGDDSQMLGFSPTILYELAAPSTPAEVIETIKAKVSAGETVTVAEVKQMKQEAKPESERKPAKEVKVENADNSNYQAKQVSPSTAPAETAKPEREPEPLTISFDESVITNEGDPHVAKRRAVQAVYDAVDAALIALQENQRLLTKDHFVANDEACQDMVIKVASALQLWADVMSKSLSQNSGAVIQLEPAAV